MTKDQEYEEVGPLAKIIAKNIVEFVYHHIIIDFGIPQAIVFNKLWKKLEIKQHFLPMEHLYTNG
ncbi:hypothetical protein CR513_28339, partial [Mucuna pruriens]